MSDSRKIRTFDFRRPDKFSKEQLRTLAVLHEHVSRRWASHFSTLFRLPCQVTVNEVEQATYDEFIRQDDGVIAVLGQPPLRGEGILTITGSLALAFIDRLFGGPGHWKGATRSLTDLERTAFARVLHDLVEVLGEGWAGLVEITPRIQRIEDNPLFVQAMAGNEAAAVISFQLRVGTQKGRIAFFLPYFMLEPLLPRLNTQAWADRYRQSAVEGSDQVHGRLRQAPINLTVVLGHARLPMRRILDLTEGEVIRLDTEVDGLLSLVVEGKPLFYGRAGRCGQRLAFRVEGRSQLEAEWNDSEEDDPQE